jgi:hypothetical protein
MSRSIDTMKFRIDGGSKRPPELPRRITMAQAIQSIREKNIDPAIEEKVLARIMRYPSNTFEMALRNLPVIVDQIKLEMKKELHEKSKIPQEIHHKEDQVDPNEGGSGQCGLTEGSGQG